MRHFKKLVLFILATALSAFAQNWSTVTASNITDLNQQKLSAGKLCFLGTDNNNVPLSFQVGGGGQVLARPFCSVVSNGLVTSFTVPNPAFTNPANVYYRVTVVDTSTGQLVLTYTRVQFTGNFNFDAYAPTFGPFAPLAVSVGTTCNTCVLTTPLGDQSITASNLILLSGGFEAGNSSIINATLGGSDPNGTIEIGPVNKTGTGNTPFIDFHFHDNTTTQNGQDFNVRLINSVDKVLVFTGVSAGGGIFRIADTLGVLQLTPDTGISREAADVIDFGNGIQADKSATLKAAKGTFTSDVVAGTLTISNITGIVQCVHVNATGQVSGTGTDCGAAGGGTGVTSIAGTTNQIIASAATGAITLSTPQNIDTGSSPTFSSMNLTSASNPTLGINGGANSANFAVATGAGSYSNFSIIGDTVLRSNSQNLILTARSASGSILFGTGAADSAKWNIGAGGNLVAGNNLVMGWSSGACCAAPDTGISRMAAGQFGFGTGAAGDASGQVNAITFVNNNDFARINNNGVQIGSAKVLSFSATAGSSGTQDTGISRSAAGIINAGNGTANDASGTVQAAIFKTLVSGGAGVTLSNDNSGGIEVGTALAGGIARNPYIDFHFHDTTVNFDNQDFNVRLANSGNLTLQLFAAAANSIFRIDTSAVYQVGTDTGISRGAAGILDFGNGAAGNISATVKAQSYFIPNSGSFVFQDLSGSTGSIVPQSDNNFVFYSTDAVGASRAIWSVIMHNSTSAFNVNTSLVLPSTGVLSINSDTGLSRDSAGVVDVGNGTAGNASGTIKAAGLVLTGSCTGCGGVLSITGTANQITASASTGAVTLSTPQNIDTGATPQFSVVRLGATDTGISRIAAGIIGFGTGAAGNVSGTVMFTQWLATNATGGLQIQQTGGTVATVTCNLFSVANQNTAWDFCVDVNGNTGVNGFLALNTGNQLKWGTDTGISRDSAGVVDFGTGAVGNQGGVLQAKQYGITSVGVGAGLTFTGYLNEGNTSYLNQPYISFNAKLTTSNIGTTTNGFTPIFNDGTPHTMGVLGTAAADGSLFYNTATYTTGAEVNFTAFTQRFRLDALTGNFAIDTGAVYQFGANLGVDAGISRDAAGTIDVGNGAASDKSGTIIATQFRVNGATSGITGTSNIPVRLGSLVFFDIVPGTSGDGLRVLDTTYTTQKIGLSDTQLTLAAGIPLSWSDVALTRDSADTLDCGNGTASNTTCLFRAGYLYASGNTAPTVSSQGAYLSWNKTGGTGETDFINNKGGGSGGWNFYEDVLTSTVASISPTGALTVNGATILAGNSLTLNGATSGSAALSATATGGTLNLGSTNATVTSLGLITVTGCTGCGSGTFSGTTFGFKSNSSADTTTLDVGFSRDSAGVFDVGNGTALDRSGSINLTNITLTGTCTGCYSERNFQQAVTTTLTGNGADQTVFTFTIPANALSFGKCVRINTNYALTNATTTVVMWFGSDNISLGATAGLDTTAYLNFCPVDSTHLLMSRGPTVAGSVLLQPSDVLQTTTVTLTSSIIVKLTFRVSSPDTFVGKFWDVIY